MNFFAWKVHNLSDMGNFITRPVMDATRVCVFLIHHFTARKAAGNQEREIFIDNLLVRVHLIIEISRPALRHGSLNSLFQVALYLPS